ncbi:hypothetical protein N8I77_001879 [Diaporthe amygdali]|uniref:FMN hydroxy acid dehydrogenase domain-containing protein n=1 Tax=Phomopsis amygdali TaxID=1214568 RepID=A0AAD9SSJ2_PHOAM|nr:hypothetical protein N8I77_001879 [Diaporthe amygdali]
MRYSYFLNTSFAAVVAAVRPFVDFPDSGADLFWSDLADGELPALGDIWGLNDFQWAARHVMNLTTYQFFTAGAAGEWSYRNNLEAFGRVKMRPRVVRGVRTPNETLGTSILGHNFSAPFYITACGRAQLTHPDAELGLLRGAARAGILYIGAASTNWESVDANRAEGQVTFQQWYMSSNLTKVQADFDRAKAAGSSAIALTVDSPAISNRIRSWRWGLNDRDSATAFLDWDTYATFTNMTDLPIILKGVQTVEDVREAAAHGVPAVILSNHGGRGVDTAPSPLEVALEIYDEEPELFDQIEVLAEGGIRYGTDVLKLLALGVRAVGLGRPFYFANQYSEDGVARAADLLKHEIAHDAANIGLSDIHDINASYIKLGLPSTYNGWYT